MIKSISQSLEDIIGKEFIEAVSRGAAFLYGLDKGEMRRIAGAAIDFFPEEYIEKMDNLLEKVGQQVVPGMTDSVRGAATESFRKACNINASPLCGLGYLRLGEDGRLYLISKSEHYHTPLGHSFPGYKLIDNARAIGITNATHNNNRGFITRLLEVELIRTANGIAPGDKGGLNAVLDSNEPHVLNRVINLETGSLAVEAGIKMMLARFYKLDTTFPAPKYEGRIPVFMVMQDNEYGRKANYHGTTVIAQTMRDLWPDIYNKFEEAGILKVCSVAINDFDDFKTKFEKYNKPPYKVAGFLHEIVLMNYGAIKLGESFLKNIYELCHANDTPVLVDEIQSCMWFPQLYLFREYGLKPDFVVIGKGFPGGQYAASRIITTSQMDNLNQFGALVTNGQEELAALAYLITMAFVQANTEHLKEIGSYYECRLRELAQKYPALIDRIEGMAHMSAINFREGSQVIKFNRILNGACIDISAQTYKAKCPPSALTKLPIISTRKMVDYLIGRMEAALDEIVKDA